MLSPRLGDAIFDVVRPFLDRLPRDRWPTHDELTALTHGVTTERGKALRFVPQRSPGDASAAGRPYYERHIADTGEIETRPQSWHDLFNALQWAAFPDAKARINAQHAAILDAGGDEEARHRSPPRDALTLFDEGGVIVAASAPEVFRAIAAFDWKRLFLDQRAELARTASEDFYDLASYFRSRPRAL